MTPLGSMSTPSAAAGASGALPVSRPFTAAHVERDLAEAQALGWRRLAMTALLVAALAAGVLVGIRLFPPFAPRLSLGAALVIHVNLAIGVWLSALLVATWRAQIGGSVLGDRIASIGAAAGTALLVLGVLFDPAPPILSNYVPSTASAWVQAGLLSYWTAIAVATLDTVVAFAVGRPCRPGRRDVCWSALPVLLALAVVAVAAMRLLPGRSLAEVAESLFWGPGHLMQFAYAWLAAFAWIRLAGASPSQPWFRAGLVLTILPAIAGVCIECAWAPGSTASRFAYTVLMACGSWPGPAWIAIGLWRDRDRCRIRSPYPLRLAAGVSIGLFAAGMLLGVWIDGQTMTIPAHYHATVGAATTAWLALIASSGARHAGSHAGAGPIAAIVYGVGATILVAGFAGLGVLGVARKADAIAAGPELLLRLAGAMTGVGAACTIGAVIVIVLPRIVPSRVSMRWVSVRRGRARP